MTNVNALEFKASARVATTANITLSGTQTIDGVSVMAGDRVLVKNQTTKSENGIYVCAAGAWSRATDADAEAEVMAGMFVPVAEGATNGDTFWLLATSDTITLGTTALTFVQIGASGGGGGGGASGVSPYVMFPMVISAEVTIAAQANQVRVMRFYIPHPITVASIHHQQSSTVSAGNFASCGVYSEDGSTLLVDSGPVGTDTAGAKATTLGSPVALTAGWYWFAWTQNSGTPRLNGPNVTAIQNTIFNSGTPMHAGQVTETSTGAQLPSTITVPPASAGFSLPVPYIKLQS